ncbi:unnamed protein product [Didymodactylos carnosus]|uniref:Uncharacterized protein n=1 Tax=Didymodactylos carnosus TaxID=1234261 RepID=A0A814MAJ5_9BILA|nr:unnamed protein product [Didymodactylos carnosus]CAF1075648.1 unnamed protein product [Didymodactylos carnosus]CAF3802928.1 unnamed protein product [Didymodactylos carnosus]CAF3842318.1 unnamed protein product [Didymodactylos carnosus]
MKSKDIQTAVKSKYENGDGPVKIYRDLTGVVSLQTIKINSTDSINLSSPPGCPCTGRTKANISKQVDARPHTHHLSQKWCADHFGTFNPKNRCPPNSSDLCPLDYNLWNELAEVMNWDHITTKATLIEKLKKEKNLHSVLDCTVRLRLIPKSGEDYIR